MESSHPARSPLQLLSVLGLLCGIVAVFIAMEQHGGSENRGTLLRFGAITGSSLSAGQWWRMVSALFVHIGTRHLVGNAAMLLVLGVITAPSWGAGRLLFVYVASGVLGNLASFAFGSSTAIKAGASGAILGLLGGLAGTRLIQLRQTADRSGSRFKSWHVLAMLIAFYGFVVGVRPSSDHIAHIGGLLSGALISAAWPAPARLKPHIERLIQLAAGATAVAACGIAALFAISHGVPAQ